MLRYKKLLENEYGYVEENALEAFIFEQPDYFAALEPEQVLEAFDEAYQGEFSSVAEFVEWLLDSMGYLDDIAPEKYELPSWIYNNVEITIDIDFVKIWEETLSHHYYTHNNYYFSYGF